MFYYVCAVCVCARSCYWMLPTYTWMQSPPLRFDHWASEKTRIYIHTHVYVCTYTERSVDDTLSTYFDVSKRKQIRNDILAACKEKTRKTLSSRSAKTRFCKFFHMYGVLSPEFRPPSSRLWGTREEGSTRNRLRFWISMISITNGTDSQ